MKPVSPKAVKWTKRLGVTLYWVSVLVIMGLLSALSAPWWMYLIGFAAIWVNGLGVACVAVARQKTEKLGADREVEF